MTAKQGRTAGINLQTELEKIFGVGDTEQQLKIVQNLAQMASTPTVIVMLTFDPAHQGRPMINVVGAELDAETVSNLLHMGQKELTRLMLEAKDAKAAAPPQEEPPAVTEKLTSAA